MRHVPLSDFDERLSQVVAAAEAGEEIALTRDGRDVVRLVVVDEAERTERRRDAVEALSAIGRGIRAKYGPTTADEIKDWIEEGRR